MEGEPIVCYENCEARGRAGWVQLGGPQLRYSGFMDAGGHDSREVLERFHGALDLVDTIAGQLRKRLGSSVELDDLVSFGREGLLDASRRYDESRGVHFRAYAQFRVRGAVYDGVRRTAALPRGLYRKLASLRAQWLASSGELFYAFSDGASEHANDLLADHLAGIAMAATLRLITEADEGNLSESTEHHSSLDPEQQLVHAELRHQIETQLRTLDAEEREVLQRHYFDGERLEEIANALNVSKSWASRLHTRALSRLGKRLQAEPGRGQVKPGNR